MLSPTSPAEAYFVFIDSSDPSSTGTTIFIVQRMKFGVYMRSELKATDITSLHGKIGPDVRDLVKVHATPDGPYSTPPIQMVPNCTPPGIVLEALTLKQ